MTDLVPTALTCKCKAFKNAQTVTAVRSTPSPFAHPRETVQHDLDPLEIAGKIRGLIFGFLSRLLWFLVDPPPR